MNRVILIGRVGKDAEFKPDVGNGLCRFSMATNERYKDKSGEWQDATTWHNVVVWGNAAKAATTLAKKGALVIVEGSVKSRTYDKDGEKRTAVEIVAAQIYGALTAPKPSENDQPSITPAQKARQQPASTVDDDEIPF